MASGSIELVRGFYRSWSDRNIDGVLKLADPDIEFDWSESRSPYQGVYRGHEGLVRFWREQTEAWEKFNIELVEAIDCGPDCVIAVTAVHGRGRGSGIAIDATGAAVWRLGDGVVLSVKLFQSTEEARQAVALWDLQSER